MEDSIVRVMIKYSIKYWVDGIVSFVISDHEIPFRKSSSGLACLRQGSRDSASAHTLMITYFTICTASKGVLHDPGLVPNNVMKLVNKAIKDVRLRALRGQ